MWKGTTGSHRGGEIEGEEKGNFFTLQGTGDSLTDLGLVLFESIESIEDLIDKLEELTLNTVPKEDEKFSIVW